MASDKSDNSSNSHPLNVRTNKVSATSMPVPLTNIKTEPGLPSTTRLPSFRLPRDLTLGGIIKTEKTKKLYTPNLNVQRTKKKEDAPQNDSVKSTASKDFVRSHRDNSQGRGRGRGSNFIQSSGIWSTGIAVDTLKRSSSSGSSFRDSGSESGRRCQTFLEKPKLISNRNVNKHEEDQKEKLLLRDDSNDDDEEYMDLENSPVILPLAAEAKTFKREVKLKIEKQEEEEEVDRKPIILENGEALSPPKIPKVEASESDSKPKEDLDNIPKIVENKTNSYILIQLPDCLPGLAANAENSIERSRRPNSNNNEKESENKCPTEFCTLNSLKPGILGKLQILKSGKTRLLLGENNLVVDVGSHVSFRQDLIAAKVDTEKLEGDLINLGPVNSTLICSPDWESMLAKL